MADTQITGTIAAPKVAATQVGGIDLNVIAQLIAEFLPLALQYGLPLIQKVIDSIRKDPNLPTDQIKQAIIQRLTEASQIDKEIISE